MAATHHQQQSSTSSLEAYISPFLVNVLEFLDVASRFRFAATNRFLREAVFGPDPQDDVNQAAGVDDSVKCIWAYMDFSTCHERDRERLTDHELRLILERVHALEVTKGLFLDSCENLSGEGLSGLHRSKVLEQLTLVSHNPEISRDFMQQLVRPLMRRSLYYVNIQSTTSTGTQWKIDSQKQLAACDQCSIWKYDCSLTTCKGIVTTYVEKHYRQRNELWGAWTTQPLSSNCGKTLCDPCSTQPGVQNRCRCCGIMITCLRCCLNQPQSFAGPICGMCSHEEQMKNKGNEKKQNKKQKSHHGGGFRYVPTQK